MHRRSFVGLMASGYLATTCCPRFTWAQLDKPQLAKVAVGKQGVVATVHPLATQAAMAEFKRGGNAIDAAVAASLVLSVVDIHNSGLGGGGLALIRSADGKIVALDGRERAPLTSSPETFIRGGKPDPELSQTGPLACGTPGLPALLEQMSKRLGKQGWQSALHAAAEIAQRGFPLDAPMVRNLTSNAKTLQLFPETARILLKTGGQPWAQGEVLVQSDLAKTLDGLASGGAAWFYEGPFAEMTERFMQSTGGLLSRRDFKEYFIADRPPIESSYRGRKVVGFPPPSSGGIHIAQMLGMLSPHDVKAIFAQSTAKGLHLLAEVMKRAMARSSSLARRCRLCQGSSKFAGCELFG